MTIDGDIDREYPKTHPWLRFWGSIDTRKIAAPLWVLLGECSSKCEHIANSPLREDTKLSLYQLYLAKGVRGTAAIEGNTLTEEDVLQHLDGKLNLPPSQAYLQQEIENIVQACGKLGSLVLASNSIPLTVEHLCELNRQILFDLPLQPDVVPGKLREHSVGVGNVYRAAPAKDLEYLMTTFCEWMNSDELTPSATEQNQVTIYALLKAVIAHIYLAWIHPFGDGNGRTARLIEFQILIESGVPAPSAHLLSNHYNLTRTEYYRQLDLASKSGGDYWPFVEYAVKGFADGLREQVSRIWQQQYDVVWNDFVNKSFEGNDRSSAQRRLHLVQDMSRFNDPLKLKEIRTLTPRIAQEYAKLTPRALSRDLKILVEQRLLVHESTGYRANRETIDELTPPRVVPKSIS